MRGAAAKDVRRLGADSLVNDSHPSGPYHCPASLSPQSIGLAKGNESSRYVIASASLGWSALRPFGGVAMPVGDPKIPRLVAYALRLHTAAKSCNYTAGEVLERLNRAVSKRNSYSYWPIHISDFAT